MRDPVTVSYTVCVTSAAALLVVLPAMPAAQRRAADNSGEGIPVATTAIARDAAGYYGKRITLSAAVEQVLSPTAFVVDQRRVVKGQGVKGTGAPILVIAPTLTGGIKPADDLLIRGEIVKFDPASISRVAPGDTLDLRDVLATFTGSPVLMAQSVRDSQYVELAKEP